MFCFPMLALFPHLFESLIFSLLPVWKCIPAPLQGHFHKSFFPASLFILHSFSADLLGGHLTTDVRMKHPVGLKKADIDQFAPCLMGTAALESGDLQIWG